MPPGFTGTEKQWELRPGIFKERMIRIALFVLGIDAGVMICLLPYHGGPKGINALALWGLPILLAGLLLGFKAASLMIAFLQRKRTFGNIQLIDNRLETGSGSPVIHLDRPFGLDARVQEKIPGPVLATVTLQQDEKQVTLYCCDTFNAYKKQAKKRRDSFMEEPDLAKKEISPPKGRTFQLEPDDFIEVFRIIKNARKGDQGHLTMETGEKPREHVEDPRKYFCSNLKTAAGASIIVLLAIIPPFTLITQSTAGEKSNALLSRTAPPAPSGHTAAPIPDKPVSPPEQEVEEIPWDIAFHIKQLKDKDYLARQISATALGKLGARALPAIPALTEALNDEVPAVRTAAAESLKQLENEKNGPNKSPGGTHGNKTQNNELP